MIKVGAETHLGGRHMSAFVSPLTAIAWALSSTSGGSTVLRKGTRRFWPQGRDRCHSLTLTCQNSPCWRSCERCNSFLSSPWAAIADSAQSTLTLRGMCVNWNELQYLACATVESQPVATRLPGVRLPLEQVIKNIKKVAGCRDTRTAKRKETRGMIEHNSEVYNHPYISFFIVPYSRKSPPTGAASYFLTKQGGGRSFECFRIQPWKSAHLCLRTQVAQ